MNISISNPSRLKAFLAATAAAAIGIGMAIPVPHKSEAAQPTKSQFATVELGHG